MLSLQPMLLAAALTVTADVEILEFTASWCGPCQEMKGTIDQLRTMGHKVYTIDFDQRQDLAKRFGVTRVPTYLKIVNGQAVDRIANVVAAARRGTRWWHHLPCLRGPHPRKQCGAQYTQQLLHVLTCTY